MRLAICALLLLATACQGERAVQGGDDIQRVAQPQPDARPIVQISNTEARPLTDDEEDRLFSLASALVCLLLGERPQPEGWALSPELQEQAARLTQQHNLTPAQLDAALRAYQQRPDAQQEVARRVLARCPSLAAAPSLGLQDLDARPLLARAAPLAPDAPPLPPEGQRYARVAASLACLGLREHPDPIQARAALLAREGLQEPQWRDLSDRWRLDPRATVALASALHPCQ
jgi:hypothetical protein